MQTDQSQEPKADQKEAKPEEPKESRKEILLRKKAKNHDHLPPALQEELDEILAKEKAQHDHAALIHTLTKNADTWGRKEIGSIKREVTDRVRVFGSQESEEVKQQHGFYRRDKKEAERIAKKAMQGIQEKLNATLKKLDEENAARVAEIHEKYKGQYQEAETEISDRVDQALALVGDFTTALPALTLDQLKELSNTGVLQVGEGDFLVLPGAEQPEKA